MYVSATPMTAWCGTAPYGTAQPCGRLRIGRAYRTQASACQCPDPVIYAGTVWNRSTAPHGLLRTATVRSTHVRFLRIAVCGILRQYFFTCSTSFDTRGTAVPYGNVRNRTAYRALCERAFERTISRSGVVTVVTEQLAAEDRWGGLWCPWGPLRRSLVSVRTVEEVPGVRDEWHASGDWQTSDSRPCGSDLIDPSDVARTWPLRCRWFGDRCKWITFLYGYCCCSRRDVDTVVCICQSKSSPFSIAWRHRSTSPQNDEILTKVFLCFTSDPWNTAAKRSLPVVHRTRINRASAPEKHKPVGLADVMTTCVIHCLWTRLKTALFVW